MDKADALAETIADHGYLANVEDVARVAYIIRNAFPEPVLRDGHVDEMSFADIRTSLEEYQEYFWHHEHRIPNHYKAALAALAALRAQLAKEQERTDKAQDEANEWRSAWKRESIRANEYQQIIQDFGAFHDFQAKLAAAEKGRHDFNAIANRASSDAMDWKARAEAAEAQLAAAEADQELGFIFWTSDNGEDKRDGDPDDAEAPERTIDLWRRLRAALAQTAEGAETDRDAEAGR
jgi:LmbE family N-acetylglucosaminyl deacetylase